MSGRLDSAREAELEPRRAEYARTKLRELGCVVTGGDKVMSVEAPDGRTWTLYPYSGWWTGKGGSARGIGGLLAKVRELML